MTLSNMSVCQQPESLQFTVTEEQRNQKMFKFKKLKSENLELADYSKKEMCYTEFPVILVNSL